MKSDQTKTPLFTICSSRTLKIAIGLATITCTLLVLINSILQVFPDPDANLIRLRTNLAQAVGVAAGLLAQQSDQRALQEMLKTIREQNPSLRSAAVRRTDDSVIAQIVDQDEARNGSAREELSATRIRVPITIGDKPWGAVELTFAPYQPSIAAGMINRPFSIAVLSIMPVSLLLFWVLLRRAPSRLETGASIPERIRIAFDVVTEGLVLLDRGGRVLLANTALLKLNADSPCPEGKKLADLPWLKGSLTTNSVAHPWNVAMRTCTSISGQVIEVNAGRPGRRIALINCAPILDDDGFVRGCLVALDDVTEEHLASERATATLKDLKAAEEEIQRKNEEIQYLTTHDTGTGCLTYSAFLERMTKAFNRARLEGTALTCMVLRIQHSKITKDSLSHPPADRVVRTVALHALACLRDTDIVGRHGSAEFLIGMPGCGAYSAAEIKKAILHAISADGEKRAAARDAVRISISIGIAALDESDTELTELLTRARTIATGEIAPGSTSTPAIVKEASTTGANE